MTSEPKPAVRICEFCESPFEPRKTANGRPQRFCEYSCHEARHSRDASRERSARYWELKSLGATNAEAALWRNKQSLYRAKRLELLARRATVGT